MRRERRKRARARARRVIRSAFSGDGQGRGSAGYRFDFSTTATSATTPSRLQQLRVRRRRHRTRRPIQSDYPGGSLATAVRVWPPPRGQVRLRWSSAANPSLTPAGAWLLELRCECPDKPVAGAPTQPATVSGRWVACSGMVADPDGIPEPLVNVLNAP